MAIWRWRSKRAGSSESIGTRQSGPQCLLQNEWPLMLSHRVVLPVAIGRLDCFRYFHQDHLFEIVLAGHDLLLACRSLCRDQGRFRSSGDKLLQLLQDNQTDLNVVEGLRLII